jgi:hypothetical protein
MSLVLLYYINKKKKFLGGGLITSHRGSNGNGLNTMTSSSSSHVQRSQGNVTTHSRYDTIEKTTTYSTSSKSNNYATVDASRVRAQGEGLARAHRNEKASFTVDTREAGK